MTPPHVLSRRPKAPTQERGERRVADLLRAAEHLFATAGYEATTMSGIAILANASIGSLYQFFPSKESVGNALLLGYMDELGARLAAWKTALPDTPGALGHDLITLVLKYVAERPACRVLAQVPSLVPESYGMEKFSASVQELLAMFAPAMKRTELSAIALAASFMVRATVQGGELVNASRSKTLRREMQQALGSYLERRLAPVERKASSPRGKRR